MRSALPLLLLNLLSIPIAQAQANFVPGTGDQMLQGMMNMMGNFAQQFQGMQAGAMPAISAGMGTGTGSGMGAGTPPPLPRPLAPLMDMMPSGQQMMETVPAFAAPQSSPLDGAWRSSTGEYLLVEGERFRLHADTERYLDGRLRTRGNVVGFLYPKRQAALLYRYRVEGDRMALQDKQGRLLLYQRVTRSR
jgi:hypothetical protein